jgi:hypothetical protein
VEEEDREEERDDGGRLTCTNWQQSKRAREVEKERIDWFEDGRGENGLSLGSIDGGDGERDGTNSSNI